MTEVNNEEQKAYEQRLRRRLKILQEKFKEGKIIIREGLKVKDSLLAVRTGPDGEIDLDTVDGLVRSMALAATHIHDREEIKKSISLTEIQNTYFSFIEQNFGQFYKIMKKKGATPHDFGLVASKNQNTIAEITEKLDQFLEVLVEFWEQTSDAAHIHVEDMHNKLKGVFGGDLFPSHDENIASKCGIYTDTIILPDPFMRSLYLFKLWDDSDRAYYFMKHALNILQYKDLACADVEDPIVVILPDMASLEQEEKKFIYQLGKEDALIHARKIFGREFESFEELLEFAKELDTIERVMVEIADPSRILFNTEWEGDTFEQIHRATTDQTTKLLCTNNPGMIVAYQGLGRMSVSNEILIRARRLRGTPIIDAPTSWKYFTWKIEYDAECAEREHDVKDLHVIRGLQNLADNEMQWLGKVPIDALIEIRKAGALSDIREILGKGIADLSAANPNNFHRTSKQVIENINDAFDHHKSNIKKLKTKKWKFAGKDVGSWLVIGTLGISAAATGMPVWGLAAIAADQLLDAPKLKDIPKSIKDLAKESNDLRQSPVGMFFKIKERLNK